MQIWVILMDGNIYAIHREENTAKADLERAKQETYDFDAFSWEIISWNVED